MKSTNRLCISAPAEGIDEDAHHTGSLSVAIQPNTQRIRLQSGERVHHCPAIVEAGVEVDAAGETAAVWIVRQDGLRIKLTVNGERSESETDPVSVEIDRSGFRSWVEA